MPPQDPNQPPTNPAPPTPQLTPPTASFPPAGNVVPPVYPTTPPQRRKVPLLIAVIAVIILAIAGGMVVWLMNRNHDKTTQDAKAAQSSNTSFKPTVSWVAPEIYTEVDGTAGDLSDAHNKIFVYPSTDSCGDVTAVSDYGNGSPNGKTLQEAMLHFISYNAKIVRNIPGPTFTFKDQKGTAYQFESVEVDLDGASSDTLETNIVAYRDIRGYAVMLDYGCSVKDWQTEQEPETSFAKAFSLKLD